MTFYEKHKKLNIVLAFILVPTVIIAVVLLIKNFKKLSNIPNTGIVNRKGGINNPGNIRNTAIKWGGEVTQPGEAFESFDTLENGIRAMYKNLLAYKSKYGIDTITAIINRWAPNSDGNNESAYVSAIVKYTGLNANAPLQAADYSKVISAMSKVEGNVFVTVDQVKNSIA